MRFARAWRLRLCNLRLPALRLHASSKLAGIHAALSSIYDHLKFSMCAFCCDCTAPLQTLGNLRFSEVFGPRSWAFLKTLWNTRFQWLFVCESRSAAHRPLTWVDSLDGPLTRFGDVKFDN
jgi:hypothetical protein